MTRISKATLTSMLAAPLALAAGMASAGGMAEPVVTPAPAPVIVAPTAVTRADTDWTGFYAGGQLGYGKLESGSLDGDADGATYGLHAGYLYDLGALVLGGEVDVDGSNITGQVGGADVDLDSVARLKLRAGYDAGNWMPYVTVGGARAATSGAVDGDGNGVFAGLGLDYRLSDSMRVGGEVLQHQFEDFNDTTGLDIDATTAALRVSFQF